jgi:hypothetical protein
LRGQVFRAGGIMSRITRKPFILLAAMLAVVAMLGGSLGMAVAGTTSLSSGFNLVGGPTGGDVQPATYTLCLPATSWSAVYIWDAPNQRWLHYFNPGGSTNVPNFVNLTANGGINVIPRFAGVAIIASAAVPNAKLLDSNGATCS